MTLERTTSVHKYLISSTLHLRLSAEKKEKLCVPGRTPNDARVGTLLASFPLLSISGAQKINRMSGLMTFEIVTYVMIAGIQIAGSSDVGS